MSLVLPITMLREVREGRTLRLRFATGADLDVIAQLFATSLADQVPRHAQAYPTMDEEEFARYRTYLARQLENPRFCAVIAEGDVGMIVGELVDRPFGKPHTFCACSALWVNPDQRRSGLTMEMLSALAQWAEARGVHTVEWLGIGTDDKWTRRGFPPVATMYQTTWIGGKSAEMAHVLGGE